MFIIFHALQSRCAVLVFLLASLAPVITHAGAFVSAEYDLAKIGSGGDYSALNRTQGLRAYFSQTGEIQIAPHASQS